MAPVEAAIKPWAWGAENDALRVNPGLLSLRKCKLVPDIDAMG
jgi:hypothetical protein